MKTIPPPFVFPFVLVEEKARRKITKKTIIKPIMINAKPKKPIDVQSNNLFTKINTKK
jgi:hypothetical protein